MPRQLFVYILSSPNRELYVGVTNNLAQRLWQHRHPLPEDKSFTARHGIKTLVYFEVLSGPIAAITREKEIKGWKRLRKLALIEESNPEWKDLGKSYGLY